MRRSLISFNRDDHFIELLKKRLPHFYPNKKTILFVEPYGSVMSLLRHCLMKQFNIILLTAHADLRMVSTQLIEAVQLALQIETTNESDLSDLIHLLKRYLSIHAVIPGFEYFVPISAKISEWLSLPTIPSREIIQFRRKDIMRFALQQAHIDVPAFHVACSIQEVEKATDRIKFPVVCKPVDAAGSVYVKKVENSEQAMAAAHAIFNSRDILWGHTLTPSVLIEEYVEGKEYSVEGIVQNGHIFYFSITEKWVANQDEFIEVGHLVNVPLDNTLKCKIENYINRVIRVLGANYCPFHAELRLGANNQPLLMEIAARLPGDKIGDLIQLARNVNYFDYVLDAYLGESSVLPQMDNYYAGIQFFYRPNINRYSGVQGIDEIQQYAIHELAVYYQPDQCIPAFPKPLRRLGHVIIQHQEYAELHRLLKLFDQKIIFLPEVQ